MITEVGRCVVEVSVMLREVRPLRDANGHRWASHEDTGDRYWYCHTHDVDGYGSKPEFRAALIAHTPEIADRFR